MPDAQAARLARMTKKPIDLGLGMGIRKNNGLSAISPVVTNTSSIQSDLDRTVASAIKAKPFQSKYRKVTEAQQDAVNYKPPVQKPLTPKELRIQDEVRRGSPNYDPSNDFASDYGNRGTPEKEAFTRMNQKALRGRTMKGQDDLTTALQIAQQLVRNATQGISTGGALAVGNQFNLGNKDTSRLVNRVQGDAGLSGLAMFVGGASNPLGPIGIGSGLLTGAVSDANNAALGIAGLDMDQGGGLGDQAKGLLESFDFASPTRLDEKTGKQVPQDLLSRASRLGNLVAMGKHSVEGAAGKAAGLLDANLGTNLQGTFARGMAKVEADVAGARNPYGKQAQNRMAENAGYRLESDGQYRKNGFTPSENRELQTNLSKTSAGGRITQREGGNLFAPNRKGTIGVDRPYLGIKKGPDPALAHPDDFEQFRGEDGKIRATVFKGDRAGIHPYVAADGTTHDINHAGPEFGSHPDNYGRVVWASAGEKADNGLREAGKQTKGLGLIVINSRDNALNSHGPRAFAVEIDAAVKSGKTTEAQALDVLRDVYDRSGVSKDLVATMTYPDALEALRSKGVVTGARGGTFGDKVIKAMSYLTAKERTTKLGIPPAEEIVAKINSPRYHDAETNSATTFVYHAPGEGGSADVYGSRPHPDYERVIPGVSLGDAKNFLPLHEIARGDFEAWHSKNSKAYDNWVGLGGAGQTDLLRSLDGAPKRLHPDLTRQWAEGRGIRDGIRTTEPTVKNWNRSLELSKRAVEIDEGALRKALGTDGQEAASTGTLSGLDGERRSGPGADFRGMAGDGTPGSTPDLSANVGGRAGGGDYARVAASRRESLTRPDSAPSASTSHVFVSPNIEEGLTFDAASAKAKAGGYLSDIDAKARVALRDVTSRTTGNPVNRFESRESVGDWADGAEHSAIITADGLDRESLRHLGAKLGQSLDQKDVLTFRAEAGGKDDLATVRFAKGIDMGQAREAMAEAGIDFRTLSNDRRTGTVEGHVFVGERGTSDHGTTLEALKRLHENEPVAVRLTEGHGEFVTGADTREAAHVKYGEVTTRYAEDTQRYRQDRDNPGRNAESLDTPGRRRGYGPDLLQENAASRGLDDVARDPTGAVDAGRRLGEDGRRRAVESLVSGDRTGGGLVRTDPAPAGPNEFELTHYSNGKLGDGDAWLDPQYAGTGQVGTEKAYLAEYKTGWVYVEGLGAHETKLVNSEPYRSVVDKGLLYDAYADPDGFLQKAAATGRYGGGVDLLVGVERLAKESGYLGVFRPGNSTNAAAARIFEPLPMAKASTRSPVTEGGPVSRQAGQVDVRLLGGIAAAGGLTVAALGNDDVKEWLKSLGATSIIQGGVAGLAALGFLYGARKGKGLRVESEGFKTAAFALSPREIGKRGALSENFDTKTFGDAVNVIVAAQGERLYRTGWQLKAIDKAGREAFGGKKRWINSKTFREWNDGKFRDTVENNINEGREWHEGLPKEWRKFAEDLKPILERPLDEAEAMGSVVRVKNDGTQHENATQAGKIKVGDILVLRDGTRVRYLGPETQGNGPFVSKGRDANANLTPATVANMNARGGANVDPIPKLRVEVVNPVRNEMSALQDNLVARRAEAQGIDIGRATTGETRIILPNEEFGRPVYRLGESFVPRILKSDLAQRVREGRVNAREAEAIAKVMEESAPEWGPISSDEALSYLKETLEGTNEKSGVRSFLRNLEQERGVTLAKYEWTDEAGQTHVVDPYESSYLDSVSTYLDRANKRVAIMRQLGVQPDALGQMLDAVRAGDNKEYADYTEKLLGRTLGLGPRLKNPKETWNQVAGAEGAYQSLTKLTTGGTHFAQLNDVTMAITEAGLPKVVRGLVDLAVDHNGVRNEVDLLNAIHADWLRDFQFGEPGAPSPTGALQKAGVGVRQIGRKEFGAGLASMADAVMTGIGLRWMDRAVKRVTMATLLRDAESALTQATKGKILVTRESTGRAGDLARKLDRYGLLDQVVRARREGVGSVLDDPVVHEQFGARVREGFQYSGGAEDLPLWTTDGFGSIMSRFKKPAYVTTRFLIQNVVGEFAQGNVKPLARLVGYGTAIGVAAGYGKNLLRLDGLDDDTKELWASGDHEGAIKRFFGIPLEETGAPKTLEAIKATLNNDPDKGRVLSEMLWGSGKALYDGGGLGLFGDLNPAWNRRVQDISGSPIPEIEGIALPVSATSLRNLARLLYKPDSEFPEEKELQGQQAFQDAMRTELPAVRRLLDMFPQYKSPLLELQDIQSKENRQLGFLPPSEREAAKGSVLSTGDYVRKATLEAQTTAEFEARRKMMKEQRGPSTEDQVYDALGVSKLGVPKIRKGTRRR